MAELTTIVIAGLAAIFGIWTAGMISSIGNSYYDWKHKRRLEDLNRGPAEDHVDRKRPDNISKGTKRDRLSTDQINVDW